MVDNSSIPVASGNELFANEDIGPGVHYPTPKIVWGANGVANRVDIASGKPFPIQLRFSGGAELSDATGIKIATTQLALLQTSFVPIGTTNATQVCIATDQPVLNKVQSQNCGMTPSRVVAAATTNATSLKASAGNIGNIDIFNVAAYDVFLKFYNKASAPTVGTDTPIWTVPLKTGTGYSRIFPYGRYFSTGIAYAITKNQADTDTTVLVAGDVTGVIDWI